MAEPFRSRGRQSRRLRKELLHMIIATKGQVSFRADACLLHRLLANDSCNRLLCERTLTEDRLALPTLDLLSLSALLALFTCCITGVPQNGSGVTTLRL